MTKSAALHEFFSGFGMRCYKNTSVPDDVEFPYLTYQGSFGSYETDSTSVIPITVNLWYYTESESVPNGKAEEISNAIGSTGVTVPCDEGFIWITRGNPFCLSQTDETNRSIKLRYINLNLRYMTV